MIGTWPAEMIDHRNGIKNDNRFENLREANRSDNMANRRVSVLNNAGIKGIGQRLDRGNGKWIAAICKDRTPQYLGTFDTAEEAKAAYDEAAIRLHGEFARS